jgi:hypothetical protein
MKILNEMEIESVSGGEIVVIGNEMGVEGKSWLVEQWENWKLGQPSVFGFAPILD